MEPKENEGKSNGEVTVQELQSQIATLNEQIGNLNKGVASERSEKKAAMDKLSTLESELKEFKGKVEFQAEDEEIDLTPEDQKKLEAWARKQGFITQDELEAEKQRIHQDSIKSTQVQAINEFLEKHPECDTDENWAKIQAEFIQYRAPSDIQGYKKLLNKIHKDLFKDSDPDDAEAKVKAKLSTKNRLTLGGGSQGSSANEMTVEKLQERYPNLSKDQIETRLREINDVYEGKAKK